MNEKFLGDFVEITSSKRIMMSDYVSDGIPFYRSKEIIQLANNQKISNELFIKKQQYVDIKNKFGVPDVGDILLTSVGTLGVAYRIEESNEFYFKDGNLTWFKNFKDNLDSKYLLYWIRSKIGQSELDEISIGSTQKALTISSIKSIPFNPPNIRIQKAIAHILGTLDEKIELNQKMNQTLEDIAKAIFKSWFVDFDPVRAKVEGKPTGLSDEIGELFPNEFENSAIGIIPKKWELKSLSNLIHLDSGFAYEGIRKGQGQNYLVTMGCVSQIERFNSKGIHPYDGEFKESCRVIGGDICLSSHDLTQVREHLGAPFIIPPNSDKKTIAAATNTFIVRKLNPISTEYLYQTFKSKRYRAEMLASAKGTAILHIGKKSILDFQIPTPNASLIEKYDEITRPITNKIDINNIQSRILIELRDTLLPKLISGELEIPDAEKFLEEAGI